MPLAAPAKTAGKAEPANAPDRDAPTTRRPAAPRFVFSSPPPTVQLPHFEGPLDLLLHLVRAGRMDIFDLPIAPLCDQYLAHLRQMKEMDLAIAGEFFVMAATLLEIKSRMLLPAPPQESADEPGEEMDPRAELVRRLLEYSRYQGIADALREREGERLQTFFRDPAPFSAAFATPPRFGEMQAQALLLALQRVLAELGAGERAVTSVRRQKITLRMTMRLILSRAEAAGPGGVPLADLLPEPPFALLEIVLLFLGLLELLKMGAIDVVQERFCGPIQIVFVPESARIPAEEGTPA